MAQEKLALKNGEKFSESSTLRRDNYHKTADVLNKLYPEASLAIMDHSGLEKNKRTSYV